MNTTEHYTVRLLSRFSEIPDRVVVWWRDRSITAAELSHSITTAAQALRREGIGEGSTVALLLNNTPGMLIARYAANLVGATVLHPQTFNAVNPLDQIPVDTQAAMLADSGVTLLVTDSQNLGRAREVAARMGTRVQLAALTRMEGEASSDLVDLASSPVAEPFDVATAVNGDIAMVTYTSGSAGRPKGVARSFACLNQVLTYFQNSVPSPTMLITTPLHGQTASLNSDLVFSREGAVVLLDAFDAATVLAAIARYRVTRLCVAPPQLYQLVEHPARTTTDTSSLQQILYTGCAASPRRISRATESFGPILTQSYGMTEAMGITMLAPTAHASPKLLTTVGCPLPQVQLAVREPTTDADLPVGQTGEICVRSPFMMEGYWRDPAATAQVLRDGWLRTGDVGYLDEAGYLHLVDRLASMIKTRGIKVYPATIEDVLLAHPAVAQAAAYKVVDSDEVEHLHAAVVAQRGATVDPDELRMHVEHRLSATHAPAKIILLDALPVLDSGKLNKRRLSLDAEIHAGWRQPSDLIEA